MLKLFFLTREYADTHRADVVDLFGKHLPELEIESDLFSLTKEKNPTWLGGQFVGWRVPKNRALQWLMEIFFPLLMPFSAALYRADALMIRDKAFAGCIALMMGKLLGKPVYYWMSFPFPEGYSELARLKNGSILGLVHHCRAKITTFLLYRVVLPRVQHAFVQSEAMKSMLIQRSIAADRMTPIPMGVNISKLTALQLPTRTTQNINQNLLVYIGTLERPRRMDILLEMMALLRVEYPSLRLLLIGDASDTAGRAWFQHRIAETKTADCVEVTGWLPMEQAWQRANSAVLGLSPFPPGELFDVASPTKVGEYLALGIVAVANNNPDQAFVLNESKAGLCVPYSAQGFADGVKAVLGSPEIIARSLKAGPIYIQQHRSYTTLASLVADRLLLEFHLRTEFKGK